MNSKIFFTLIAVFSSQIFFGQEIPKLKLTQNGVEPIVVELANSTANELYEKSINWVKETYKSPDAVLKATIENEKIRVNGFSKNAYWYKALGIKYYGDINYSLEIEFKDGKYRFNYIIDNADLTFCQKNFFKKGKIRKSGKDAVPALEETMNDLSQSFYNYVTGKNKSKKDDW
jgi:hypothetical protein